MTLIDETVAQELKEEFQALKNPVRLLVFSQALADGNSEQVRRLVVELGELDSRLKVESFNFVLDSDKVEAMGIKRIPAIAILPAEGDYGIRFYGVPTAYEFGTLIDAIQDVSQADSALAPSTRDELKALAHPVHIQVFSTPTCGYCPAAVRLAYRFAIESDKVSADGVEVTGFPDLAQRYRISTVPKTVVGDKSDFVGAGPEAVLLKHVLDAAAPGIVTV